MVAPAYRGFSSALLRRAAASLAAAAPLEVSDNVLERGLPILGVDGTLFNIQTGSPARGKVFAKTGTWGSRNLLGDNGLVTKGLAGYVTTRRGHNLAFAFYINRMAGKSSVDTSKDAAHYAGETLAEMAADAYLLL